MKHYSDAEGFVHEREPLVFIAAINVIDGHCTTKTVNPESWRTTRDQLRRKYPERLIFTRHNRAAVFAASKYFHLENDES